ncbi:MAG: hypothetical protein M0P71_15160 [Melioribacteraceae bacterium]|jgi:FtsZ-binding cell division protein ZapB|nr:hypothetical protein [Melioribacteraceae bacterium]
MENTHCPTPDCHNRILEAVKGLKEELDIQEEILRGIDGRGGLVKDNEDIKNEIFDNEGKSKMSCYIKKVPTKVWVPLLIFSIGILGTTIYNAAASASKQELTKLDGQVQLINKDVNDIKESQSNLILEMHNFKKDIKEELKNQRDGFDKKQEFYFNNIKQLMETYHQKNK